MARYMVERNFVQVLGHLWMPQTIGATEYPVRPSDIATMQHQGTGTLTREMIAEWLGRHAGDFQWVTDFSASIGDDEFPWHNEESASVYNDCMYGEA